MDSISLYRGNLHRVSDIPHRWPMPQRALSLAQFRQLLNKRNLAVSLLSFANHNVNPSPNGGNGKRDYMDKSECPKEVQTSCAPLLESSESGLNECKRVLEDQLTLQCADSMQEGDKKDEVICKLNSTQENEEEKKDLEQKLHLLNEKKHYLVQMLKQTYQPYENFSITVKIKILNAEEEIKRRSTHSVSIRPSAALQTEALVEMSCAARNPAKIGVEVNFVDAGGESDATANHSIHARQWPPMQHP